MKDKDLKREEVRGLFVIGIITVLFAVRQIYGIPTWLDSVASLILPTWSLYVFLMALAVSDDVFSKRRCENFKEFALFFFSGGFLFSSIVVMLTMIKGLRDIYLQDFWNFIQIMVIIIILIAYIWWSRKKSKK